MKEVNGYPKYKINEKGEVFSYFQPKPRKLKPRKVSQKGKYLQVSLYNENCRRHPVTNDKLPDQIYLHDLVYENFIGDKPKGMTIDHIDNNAHNNHVSNLQLMTQGENSIKGGGHNRRHDLWDNKQDVIDKYHSLKSLEKTAQYYGCSTVTIWRLVNNKTKRNEKGSHV